MASITYDMLNELMEPHDVPYQWPGHTCLHPAMDLGKHIIGYEPEPVPILELSESDAEQVIINDYNASWFNYALEYLGKHGYGYPLQNNEPQCGDLVEVYSDRVRPVGGHSSLIRNPVAIIANNDTLFIRGHMGVVPLPIRLFKIISSARIQQCHNG